MPATQIGKNWGDIWESGVWQTPMWSQNVPVSIGRAWAAIWKSGVWKPGVWSDAPFLIERIYPDVTLSTFQWNATGGSFAEVLADENDSTFISAIEVGSIIQVTLTDPPTFTSIAGGTIRVRARVQ